VSIIAPADATKVKSFLQDNLRDPVTVELFSQKKSPLVVPGRTECEYCEETEQLLGEVAEMSDKVRLTVHDVRATPEAGAAYGIQPDMVPAIVLRGENKGTLRYFGIPAGYEFTGFLQNLADVSTGSTKLSEPTKEELTKLRADVHIRVFVTPT
jgi:alkyl hydroperoxide reductase subunit AhpF